jgi:hypothetical protein
VPQEIGAEQDDNGAQHTMDDPGQPRVLRGEVNEVDTPPPREHRPAPMIKSARMPRSRTTVTTLGGPSAISCEPAGRSVRDGVPRRIRPERDAT